MKLVAVNLSLPYMFCTCLGIRSHRLLELCTYLSHSTLYNQALGMCRYKRFEIGLYNYIHMFRQLVSLNYLLTPYMYR